MSILKGDFFATEQKEKIGSNVDLFLDKTNEIKNV